MRRPLLNRRIPYGAVCLLFAALPSVAQAQPEPRGDSGGTVLWEAAPVAWFEQGQVVLLEAENIDVEIPAQFAAEGGTAPTQVAFPTGIGLELRAERTSFDAQGRPESPTRSISYGAIWVATSVSADTARPHIRDVIASLAAGPLSAFEQRAPVRENQEPARFFTFAGSPFFTEEPTWICFESADGSFAARTLRGESWTAPSGAPGVRTVIGAPLGEESVCRSIRNRIRSEAGDSTSFPTRLVSERKPRRRLTFALFRSYESTSEVTAAGSRLSLGRDKISSSMPSDSELDLWLARSVPVAMRFRLEEAADEERCQWNLLEAWTVAVHLPQVERPDGGVEEDLLRWEENLAELAATRFKENVIQNLRGVGFLDASDLQSSPRAQSEGFRGGKLIESLTGFLGTRSAVAVVCRGDAAVYSLFPRPATWMPVRNGESFCGDLNDTLSQLGRVPLD